MAKKGNTVKAHIVPRHGTAADWTLANPVLLAGELGVETDTGRFKFGNGANPWNELPYSGESGGGLTEIPVATEDTVGGFKSNPRGDVGAVEILGDGTAEVDTVRQAQSADQADRLASSRTIPDAGGIYLTHDTITLTLPSYPVVGTMFVLKIVGAHDHGVNIKVGRTGHYINDGKSNKKTTIGFQGGEFQLLFWDGDTWQHCYCPCH